MDTNNLMKIIVSAVIGVVVFAAILVPVTGEATTTEKTFTNEAYYSLNKIDEDTDVTLKWEIANPDIILIDDEEFDMSSLTVNRGYTIVGSESVMIRYYPTASVTYLEYIGDSYVNENTNASMTYVEITISDNVITLKDDRANPTSLSSSVSGDSYYIAGAVGDYAEVMKDSTTPAYVKGDSAITLIGSNTPVKIGIYGEGTMDDGLTISTVYKDSGITSDVTYSTPVATYTQVDGYEDLYLLENYKFTMTYDETTENATYSYFIVPAEVTAELSVHPDASQIALINIIPLLVLVGLVLGVVGAVLSRRD